MTIIIVGAIGYYLFFMGGINTIKGILGFGGDNDNSNNNRQVTNNSTTGNISSINNNVSGSHGSFQQTSDINGVITKKNFSFYGSPRYI